MLSRSGWVDRELMRGTLSGFLLASKKLGSVISSKCANTSSSEPIMVKVYGLGSVIVGRWAIVVLVEQRKPKLGLHCHPFAMSYMIWCIIIGNTTPFSVKINQTESVDDLKMRIRKKIQWAKKLFHKRSKFSCEPNCSSENKGKLVGILHNKGRHLVLQCAK